MENIHDTIGMPNERFTASFCPLCTHFEGKEKGVCPAFPDGIPDKFAIRLNKHSEIEKEQTGTTVADYRVLTE